ncbi:uncharacterized protein LOC118645426 [Monomorium pharaonis]|uniref:uncharacterized protein LOC118645426 n=1 Tax=Monomorium pharaonis TaxID=307658 RepID=UPI001746F368|nr:uncharacterized protein LOC118645426 [Monomorium pharaonis]
MELLPAGSSFPWRKEINPTKATLRGFESNPEGASVYIRRAYYPFAAGNKGNSRTDVGKVCTYVHICIYSKRARNRRSRVYTYTHGQLLRRTDVTHLLPESNESREMKIPTIRIAIPNIDGN